MENEKNTGAPAPETKKRRLVTALAAAGSIIVALAVFLMIWYLGDKYPDFGRFRREAELPGLEEGFIPQGVANYGEAMYVSGYMDDGSPSRIYVLDDTGVAGYVTIELEGGKMYTGHAGGIATNGSKFWVVSGGKVYVLDRNDITEQCEQNGSVTPTSTWDPHCRASFCFYDGVYFYVGEFYRSGNYETDESHHFTTPAGDENRALILRYSSNTNYSETFPADPSRAYSITGEVQGMAMNGDGNRIVLSQSYALKNSHMLVYNFSSSGTKYDTNKLKINGNYVPRLYYLDSSNLVADYEIPSMSEGMCAHDDTFYVIFESASKKYRLFTRERLTSIYSFRVRI